MLYPAPLHGLAPDLHSTTAIAVLYSGTELGGQVLPAVEQLLIWAAGPGLVASGKELGHIEMFEARHSVRTALVKALTLNAGRAHWQVPPTGMELGIALQSTCSSTGACMLV